MKGCAPEIALKKNLSMIRKLRPFAQGTSHNLHLLNKPIPAGSGSLTFRDTY